MIGLFLLAAAATHPAAQAMNANQAAATTVMGTISLKPSAGEAPSNVLDTFNCANVVVTATNDAGMVVASAPARPGSAKGECIYSLKVPRGENVLIGLRDVKLPSPAMRKAGGDTGSAKYDKRAQVGLNQGTIYFKGLQGASKGTEMYKAASKSAIESAGPVRRDLNAIFVFEATRK